MQRQPHDAFAVPQPLSRRGFLRRSAAATAATALAGAAVPYVHAAGGASLKIGLVGCGGRGTGAAQQALSTKEPVQLWAMADVLADRLEASLASLVEGKDLRRKTPAGASVAGRIDVPPERRFTGFDAYEKLIQSGVDVVLLATPPHFRPIHYEYAVAQGKHVFMEKPLAVDAPGVRTLLAANEVAKKKKLKVGVGFQRHHQAVYLETIPRIKDGAIGELLFLRCYWNGSGSDLPPRAGQSEMEYQIRNWYRFPWLSGDHIVEQHCHNLDVANWILGEHPIEAQGMGGRQWRRLSGSYDHHAVEFTYPGGVKLFSYCRQIPGCWNQVAEFAHGAKGTADVSKGSIEAGSSSWRFRGSKANPYQVEHDDLFRAILDDKPYFEADYGAMSTMTAVLGRMATYSGQRVTWDTAFASPLRLAPERYALDADPPVLPDAHGAYVTAIPGVTKAW